MTSTTFPLDKITEALDVLQEHGVIDDSTADHSLGCWLEDNGLTDDDLNNFEPEQATREEMGELIDYYCNKFYYDKKGAIRELAYVLTSGGRRDEALYYIEEFKEEMAEMDEE